MCAVVGWLLYDSLCGVSFVATCSTSNGSVLRHVVCCLLYFV